MRAEQSREERVELLRRQVVRRMKHSGVANGWNAWTELWQERTYAKRRLRQIGNRLHKPELACAFSTWESLVAERREHARKSEFEKLREREQELAETCAWLKEELGKARAEAATRIARAEQEKASALQRQLTEMTGSAAEIAALRDEEAREERVELLRRQIARRIMFSNVSRGWTAWIDLWEAKTFAMGRLQQCANRLKAPTLANAFNFWSSETERMRKAAEWERLEAQASSVEAQLRQSRYENKQMALIQTAHVDELRALRAEVAALGAERKEREAKLVSYLPLADEVERLRALLAKAEEEAKEAAEKQKSAESDVLQQLDSSQQLLEKLLAEQRAQLEGSSAELKSRLSEELRTNRATKSELTRLTQAVGDQSRAHEAEAAKLRDEIEKLKNEVARLKKPPPAKRLEARGKPSPLGNFDLDEGPDAPPISQQLADALRKNSTRVLDLFRSWDADGDGEVTRKEFHKAMPNLGLEVPKESIDELFTEWDKDGGGALNLKELQKILSQARVQTSPPPKVEKAAKSAVNVMAATKALSKMGKK